MQTLTKLGCRKSAKERERERRRERERLRGKVRKVKNYAGPIKATTVITEDLKASSDGAAATLCGSPFHSATVRGKKEFKKYNLGWIQIKRDGSMRGLGLGRIWVWDKKGSGWHEDKIICQSVF